MAGMSDEPLEPTRMWDGSGNEIFRGGSKPPFDFDEMMKAAREAFNARMYECRQPQNFDPPRWIPESTPAERIAEQLAGLERARMMSIEELGFIVPKPLDRRLMFDTFRPDETPDDGRTMDEILRHAATYARPVYRAPDTDETTTAAMLRWSMRHRPGAGDRRWIDTSGA